MIPFIPVVCISPQDYKHAHEFLRQEHRDSDLGFPTLVAFSPSEGIVGLMSTRTDEGLVVAGPLVVKRSDRPRPFITLRLIDAYDNTLLSYGVTRYIFSVEKAEERWLRQVQRAYQLQPYAETDQLYYFLKVLR